MSTSKKLIPLALTALLILGIYNCSMATNHSHQGEQVHTSDPGHGERRQPN